MRPLYLKRITFVTYISTSFIATLLLTVAMSTMAQNTVKMQSTGLLEYEIRGEGEAILLIHGAFIQDAMLALADEDALKPYKLIRYFRRGYGGSATHDKLFSMGDEAADAIALLKILGAEKVHVVGYSSGGVIATELALAAPELVQSLILLEPALDTAVIANLFNVEYVDSLIALYESGDELGAIEGFETFVGGENWREDLSTTLPGSVEQVEENGGVFFEGEIQGVIAYKLPQEKAMQIKQSVLLMLSDDGAPKAMYANSLKQWIPEIDEFIVPDANHNLPWKQSRIIAEKINNFISVGK